MNTPHRMRSAFVFVFSILCASVRLAAQATPPPVAPAKTDETTPPKSDEVVPVPAAQPKSAPASKPATESDEEIVALSPFTVEADTDEGYQATQTLNGTRFRSELKDIGSSLTVFTEQMMDDLGANSINDLMAFAPNTDVFVGPTADTAGNGNDFINLGTQYVTRGGATTVVSQDFFATNVPNDRFNTESLTFTRGPNAILFGLGNASGAFVSSSKRARTTRTATTVAYQVDDRGSYRGTLDHNQVLKKDFAAIRYAGVYEALNTYRIPTENFQRRHYGTLTLNPFKSTVVRFNYEKGLINVPAVRPWPDFDGVSPWLAAGSPIIPVYSNTTTGKPFGTVNYTNTSLVSTEFSIGGVQIPTQFLTNQGQSARPSFANGFPVNGNNFRSLVNDAIYPTFASAFGNTALRLNDYRTYSAFLEQRITDNFFVELAYNKLANDVIALNGLTGGSNFVFVDPNAQLPNGDPNPNVGKLYVEGGSTRIDNPNETENVRFTASYNLDFHRFRSEWLRYLGRHQAAFFMEESETASWSSNNALRNVSAVDGSISSGITYRYYFEPEKGKIGTSGGKNYLQFPVLYAGTPIPQAKPTGLTPVFYSQQGLNMNASLVKTRALATQSFFWKDRIVVTYGLRKDDSTSWRGNPVNFAALRDANGSSPDGEDINLRQFLPGSRRERGGKTNTRGLVFHAAKWLSFTYNTSNNFQVNDFRLNVYGDLLPDPSGKGSDYGVKLALLDRKLFFEATYYTNSNINAPDNVSSNAAGDFKSPIDRLWQAVATFTGDPKYSTYPYNSIGTTWQDAVSTTSEGWEFSLTARPLSNWRVSLNGSKRGDNTTTERGPFITQYLAEYLPVIESHPEWQALNLPTLNIPVSQAVINLKNTLANFEKIRGSPSAQYASNWTLNLIQNYQFTGALKGFSVGSTMNARGKAIGGFQVDANNILDVTKPYYTSPTVIFGASISYRRKLFDGRINWNIQMNVRNLLDDYTVYPLYIVDSRDGLHTPSKAVFNVREPRTYLITSTFNF